MRFVFASRFLLDRNVAMRLAQGWLKMVRLRLWSSSLDARSPAPRRHRRARSRRLRVESLENRALMAGLVGDLWADGCSVPVGSSEASSASNEQGEFAIASAAGEEEIPEVNVVSQPVEHLSEGGTESGGFTLGRTSGFGTPLTVTLTTSPFGSHGAGSEDYTAPLTATFAADELEIQVWVTAINDTTVEYNESFRVYVASGAGYTVGERDFADYTIRGVPPP